LAVAAVMAAVTMSPVDSSAKYFSLKLGDAKKLVVDLSSGPHVGPGSPYMGVWLNQATGLGGSMSTFSRSETTGTQIVEFKWEQGPCPGTVLGIPSYVKESNKEKGKSDGKETTKEKTKIVINVFGGYDCHGPVGNFRIVFDNEEENTSTSSTDTTQK
jgi:hypothetical protein